MITRLWRSAISVITFISQGLPAKWTGITALATAAADTIRVRAELNDTPGIQTAEPSEDVTYFWDPTVGTVFRDNGTGPQAMITNVTNFQIEYFDVDNQLLVPLPLTTQLSSQVRSIGLAITTTTNQGGDIAVTTRIGLRNTSG